MPEMLQNRVVIKIILCDYSALGVQETKVQSLLTHHPYYI